MSPTSNYTAQMQVWRGDATGGHFVNYSVEAGRGEVVLDVLHRLQATQCGDLAVRWNCKAGKCGSCSAEINGLPRLMCMTRMALFDEDELVRVAPMRTFPVIRDLVTDVSYNYVKAKEVPELKLVPRPPEGYRMAQEDIERLQEFHKCIECFMCQNVCHVVRDHEENKLAFAGPRIFLKYAELDMHPLSATGASTAARDAGIGYCNITKCCSEVCPEEIHITDNAIIPLKERVVDKHMDPLVWLGNKIGRRTGARDQH
jgi:succinate dehydrogenase / fumarate reductase iron-sulfur subunit